MGLLVESGHVALETPGGSRRSLSGAYADYGEAMSETPIVQKGLAALSEPVKGAVITVSDRCVSGEREDLSGPLAQRLLAEHDVVVEKVDLVPDGVEPVREAIRRAVAGGARVVLTTGGTGVTPRDLTPEATAPLLETRIEGIEAQIRAPGSRGGVKDTVAVVGPLVPHVLEQLGGGDH